MNVHSTKELKIVPGSLKDAPAFIERQFPVNRVSAETHKERKAIHGQILTSLGSYWKGRKPLILVRATLLGTLLPATKDPLRDLQVFLLLMGMADHSIEGRLKPIKPAEIDPDWPRYRDVVNPEPKPAWRKDVPKARRHALIAEWLLTLPYGRRLAFCLRPEECGNKIYSGIWDEVNAHLGTTAQSPEELVGQLGVMRFGHRPLVADLFAGGGSIPFEAARIGCDVLATDLNPIACMLTWGAFNIIAGGKPARNVLTASQADVTARIKSELDDLAIEKDAEGRQAKAYLYCVEVTCPKTGYRVPLAPSWVISRNLRTVAKLVPRPERKDYEILIVSGASDAEIDAADKSGTLVDERLVHPANADREGVALAVIRGDRKDAGGEGTNLLRRWSREDIIPAETDIFGERLYCIQWMNSTTADVLAQATDEDDEDEGPSTFFAAPTEYDLANEARVVAIVKERLSSWQQRGLVPEMRIEPGEKTDEPIRTRGWTYWHHLFTPRHLLFGAITLEAINDVPDSATKAALLVSFCRALNYMSRLTQWMVRTPTPKKPADVVNHVFYNQALNTFYNFGCRASIGLLPSMKKTFPSIAIHGRSTVATCEASAVRTESDIYVTDPPYADAINYHEITEYFIAWVQALSGQVFPDFVWDSRRNLAIKGVDEKFRSDMAAAYGSMAKHMAANGIQVVMFTRQDAGVWADLAAIMWAAGLRVTAAWSVVTETESSTKKGKYVQGTILLVLRKRREKLNGRRMDIEGEIEDEVKAQLRSLNAIDDEWRAERLYTDSDLQLAAYAAALRVITTYETIDRQDVGADVFRKRKKGEKTVILDLIEYAASVANNMLVPDGFPERLWRDLDAASRFYVRMLDVEHKGSTKFADFENFAKTFALSTYQELMAATRANKSALAGAADLKGRLLGSAGFGVTPMRRVLFAVYKTLQKDDPKEGLAFLKTELGAQDYWTARLTLADLAVYLSAKTQRTRPKESMAANLVAEALRVDRL
jgi:putative DNA methylase